MFDEKEKVLIGGWSLYTPILQSSAWMSRDVVRYERVNITHSLKRVSLEIKAGSEWHSKNLVGDLA